LYIERNWLYD